LFRITRDDQGNIQTLETPIVRFVPAGGEKHGATVDFMGAVHLGEKSYYERLDKGFDRYEAVLYEGILPRKRQLWSMRDRNPFMLLNRALAMQLHLEYQPVSINYRRPNFVHADMLGREYRKSIRGRHEGGFLGVPVAFKPEEGGDGEAFDKAVNDGVADFFQRYLSAEPGLALKRQFVTEFLDAHAAVSPLFLSQASTMLTERNQVVLKVLKTQIKLGKRLLAILYGVGHLPDLETRLVEQLGLRRQEEHWLVAWDLRESAGLSQADTQTTAGPQG
jgi:hypothetical protein